MNFQQRKYYFGQCTAYGTSSGLTALHVTRDRCAVGKYKVEVFDKESRVYMPTRGGLGMHVEVRDPDEKTLMSRVSNMSLLFCI